jgi:hypothetical protein
MTRTIDSIIEDINSSSDDLVMIRTQDVQGYCIFLCRKIGQVSYENYHFHNLKGLRFQVDNDFKGYFIDYAGRSGVCMTEESLANQEKTSSEIKVGQNEIIDYLKKIDEWDHGIAFAGRWDSCLSAIDLYVRNQLTFKDNDGVRK